MPDNPDRLSTEREEELRLLLAFDFGLGRPSATVWHVWVGQALVWLFVAKWMLILCFDLPAAAPSHPTGRPNE